MLALTDPRRVHLCRLIARQAMTTTDLADRLSMTRPQVARHLRALRDLGLVQVERHGRYVHYGLDLTAVERIGRDVSTACSTEQDKEAVLVTGRYPVVCHRELRPRWRWSAWRERRHPLIAGRGEVLVYVVEGAFTTELADPARCTAVALVDVRPKHVSADWELTTSGSDWDFPVTVTFRCTVVDPAAVTRSRLTGGSPWDAQHVLAQAPRPSRLMRVHPVGDEGGLRLALTALLQARPAHQDIAGVRVNLVEVSVGPARDWVDDEA